DGAMGASKKYRGSIDSALQKYVKDLKEELLLAEQDRVFITHSGCDQAVVDAVYQYLEELHHFSNIYVTRAGGVISSHCGPGTLGVLYID
ncbi:MAG: DegV family protein, partial [Lachnospiraceae bacterium]|nr:DegV family protein [Lachnospiraceae bacterium]